MPEPWDSYLQADENLLWQGRPPTRLYLFRKQDVLYGPFAMLWGTVAYVVAGNVWAKDGGGLLKVIAILMVAMFFQMVLGRFLLDRQRRKNTLYALTNKRALILLRHKLRDKDITPSTEIIFHPNSDGAIHFDCDFNISMNDFRTNVLGLATGFEFLGLEDADQAYALVRSLQDKQR